MAGRSVGLILSGGNIERTRLLQVLGGVTPPAASVGAGDPMQAERLLDELQ